MPDTVTANAVTFTLGPLLKLTELFVASNTIIAQVAGNPVKHTTILSAFNVVPSPPQVPLIDKHSPSLSTHKVGIDILF